MSNYDRLSALDNSFLLLESPNSYTHVASTLIFEAGPLRLEDGGIDFEAIKKAHDPHFDLDYHLRHPLIDRLGLGIALMSYDGALHWGVNADRELVPDASAFVAAIEESFDALLRIADES